MVTALMFATDSASATAPASDLLDMMYAAGPAGSILLAVQVRPIAECSVTTVGGGGATTVTLSVTASLGTFTRAATTSTAGQVWSTVSKQPVGQLAALTDTTLLRALSCQMSGTVWNSASETCVSPVSASVNGVIEIVSTAAASLTSAGATLVALALPAPSGFGYVGHTDIWCSSSGVPSNGEGALILAPGSTATPTSTWTQRGTSTAPTFQWSPPVAGGSHM
jgi:hypothetical protein